MIKVVVLWQVVQLEYQQVNMHIAQYLIHIIGMYRVQHQANKYCSSSTKIPIFCFLTKYCTIEKHLSTLHIYINRSLSQAERGKDTQMIQLCTGTLSLSSYGKIVR